MRGFACTSTLTAWTAAIGCVAGACGSARPDGSRPSPRADTSASPTTTPAPSASAVDASNGVLVTMLDSSAESAGLEKARFEGDLESGYILTTGSGDASRAWLLSSYGRASRTRLLFGQIARADLASPGIVLWEPGGRAILLDATDWVAVDDDATTAFARRGDAPRVYQLPVPFRGAGQVSLLEGVPPTATTIDADTRFLDPRHLLAGSYAQRLVELPSLEERRLPEFFLAAQQRTALTINAYIDHATFSVYDAFTGALVAEIDPPTKLAPESMSGKNFGMAVSMDGSRIAFAQDHTYVADLDARPIVWRFVAADAFEGDHYGGIAPELNYAFSADASFVCATGVLTPKIVPITGSPPRPAGARAFPHVRTQTPAAGACEVAWIQSIADLRPIENRGGTASDASTSYVDPDNRFIAALHEVVGPPSTKGDVNVELVIADPASGTVRHRILVGAHRGPARQMADSSLEDLSVQPTSGGRLAVHIQSDQTWDVIIDPLAGARVEPPSAPASTRQLCLHADGSLGEASTCAGNERDP